MAFWKMLTGQCLTMLCADRLEDLLRRFETPDSRNRWDAPLFTVKPGAVSRLL
jgi:tRNA uridine 5-carbamoylmethylation protein Kti12